ncbi:MAG: hypothetical protein A2015_08475 [Spirochaetes bacterium GWF1_31_7]|nr:MAG: hypothetical protein A2Y30_08670 [Spirochaetes bacterium GWE1_32_154]OHD47181.1 MAG: hypothetical protein A2015_08475 [Spirochaetes bacterium GWF1_31_7]OHD47492.1 MAG: hypothetical protein A2Y29_08895 [Spirochaetes bacterium GWE2_31_10]OHD82326.1 MAG: hypothetical protein A2355_15305 [Spirochaetes bacterium RIFOXYB1_FULL_32_8]HBD92579.1 DUF2520 domain-containing protein [Spirochaetia bacterium]
MNIGFYGASKAGTSLGLYCKSKDVPVTGYYSRDPSKSLIASKMTSTSHFFTVQQLIESSDCIIISVSDSAILEVIHQLRLYDLSGLTLIHLSGAMSAYDMNIHCNGRLSLHPIQSLTGTENDIEKLNTTIFSIEGDRTGLKTGEELLGLLGNTFVTLKKEQKVTYHYAATLASNYLVSLLDYSFSMYKKIGFDDDSILNIIASISTNTLSNYLKDRENALTGPASRGDIETLDKHFKSLDTADEKEIFVSLLKMTLGYLERKAKE